MKKKDSWVYWGACALLLVLWGLLMVGARFVSLSMDEPFHIVRGYIFLARGADELWYMLLQGHPPLLNVMEALGIFAAQPLIPLEALEGWGENFLTYTDAFLPYLTPLERTEVVARTPMMFLTVLLGALIFRWGKDIGGPWRGLLALALLSFDPLMLAHGRLANTDTGVALFGTAALYTGWRWLHRPSWRWGLITGGLLGLTLLSKFSGFLWGAAFGLMALEPIVRRWRQGGPVWVAQATAAGILAFSLVWAGFGFSVGETALAPFPLPAPVYWTSFIVQQSTAAERIFIALGRLYQGPQWWYFPFNFVIKNPLPLLAVFLFGGWSFVRHKRRHPWHLTLLVFPLLYTLVSISGGMNVSYRHMLPVHPFLYLIASDGLIAALSKSQQRRPEPRPLGAIIAWGALGVWYIVGTLRLFPDEMTYFNELVNGPEGGHRYLVDYTQEWGQAYKELGAYLSAHPGPEPQVFYFTNVHPGFYGIAFQRLLHITTPFHPQPGRYVLGPPPLYGLVGSDPMEFNWFWHAHPEAMVGHSLFVYDVVDQPAWVSQCTIPVVPLDDVALASGFGRTGLRQTQFDCTTTWLYPGGIAEMGVYALHHDLLQEQGCRLPSLLRCDPVPVSSFVARHLAKARLSYEQREFSLLPAFALYERESDPLSLPPLLPVQTAPADTPPVAPMNTPSLTAPVPLEGPLTFLGAAVYPEGDGLEVETWWQVTEGPISRPLSIMAHLLRGDGEVLGVADGLGVSPLILTARDVVVQRHRFPVPLEETEVWLRTGAYWLDTMERWALKDVVGVDALFVPLKEELR